MKEQLGQHHYGEARAGTDEKRAEQIVREGLRGLGWGKRDLATRPKGDLAKIKLAQRLRAETTVTIKWIAQRLRMGTWTYANSLLYHHRRKK